ncbi:Interactor of constitutive active ROPs 4 [Sesamum angolense]|uniref:Interactor of constitutive active ROPs 4 n=1 Tax=Sesamum angolense TaxID=2727404 RepID=A0AAE1WS16_9LAMI|nr:Interactor of constitutive active ROPs 4 [Sesamum angolense]
MPRPRYSRAKILLLLSISVFVFFSIDFESPFYHEYRAAEIAHRQSPRGPPNIRASSSDSDPLHLRPRTERSPKLAEGRSARGSQSDPSNQKKLGTRIADLESQLTLAQEELKSLKGQLVPTEAAKRAAQDQHEKKSKKQQKETDVFEVPIEKVTLEPKSEQELPADEDELNPKSVSLSTESPAMSEPVNPLSHELSLKNDEINMLKTNLDEKDQELEAFRQENEGLKNQLDEKSVKISSAESEVDDLKLRLDKAGHELEESRISFVQINEKLEAAEKAKAELENEMKLLRIQTEQWRKAADAAASVLAGGVEMNGRRISQRCGSMDKHYVNSFEPLGGYGSYVGSPGLNDDPDDVFGGEKRKGSGIRMLGDLWKKKGQK